MTEKTIQELLEFGILNLDKPANMTSFDVSEFARKKLGLKKTSHFGTLDPQVTGVLPVALNRACKLTGFFLKKNKTYVGIMRLHKEIEEGKLKEEMEKFVGKIMQLPPVKSRVKREERERQVYSWKILEKQEREVLFEVECEAGTYVRKLIHDLGEKIGGAHMTELRRTKAGIFLEQDKEFVNLYDFEKAVDSWNSGDEQDLRKIIIPADEAIKKIMPVVQVKKESLNQLLTGKPVFLQDIDNESFKDIKEGQEFSIFFGEKFIEIAKRVDEEDIIARPLWVKN